MKGTVFQDIIDQSLMELHTGFCGTVVSVQGNLAAIQPLNMIKEIGGQSKRQAVIPNCPILQNAKKFVKKEIATSASGDPSHGHTVTSWDIIDVATGDTVYCVCAERDISETRGGSFATPVAGHHSLAGAVVVGVL